MFKMIRGKKVFATITTIEGRRHRSMDSSWERFGYPVRQPCEVCKKVADNKLEPRFGYVICEEHHEMTPVEVSRYHD